MKTVKDTIKEYKIKNNISDFQLNNGDIELVSKEYADQQKQQIIQIIEDRIAELENQIDSISANEIKQELQSIINDHKHTLKLIK